MSPPTFPGLSDGWARFDGPGGTQMVDCAIDAMASFLRSGANANSHGVFAASAATDALVGGARETIGRLLGADPQGVVFGPNMTTLTFAFTRAIGRALREADEVVCTRLDHDANVTPWVMAAEDAGARVVFAEFDARSGRLSADEVARCLSPRTRWVAVTGASNAIGTIPDIAAIATAARAAGARLFVDAVHLAAHRRIAATSIGCDVLVCSPYKWYGPHAGVLWGRPELLEEVRPYKVRPAGDSVPQRFETGTSSFEAIAGAAAAAEFLLDVGMGEVERRETEVFAPLLDGLLAIDEVTVHGPTGLDDRTPTVAFNVDGRSPEEVARSLANERIAVWSGNYYAVEAMAAMGLADRGGAVRAGVSYYTTAEDVERLLSAVTALAKGAQ